MRTLDGQFRIRNAFFVSDYSGDIIPYLDSTYDIGSSTKKLDNIWANTFNGSIQDPIIETDQILMGYNAPRDISMARTAVKTLVFDDAAGGNITTTFTGGVNVTNGLTVATITTPGSSDLVLNPVGNNVNFSGKNIQGAAAIVASTSVSTPIITTGAGDLSINPTGTAVNFNSKNLTSVGTIGSGAITSTSTIQGTTINATTQLNVDVIDHYTSTNPIYITRVNVSNGEFAQGADATNAKTYLTGTIAQTTFTVTGTGTNWTSIYLGALLKYSDGTTAGITAVNSTTSLTVDVSKTVVAGSSYTIQYDAMEISGNGTAQFTQKVVTPSISATGVAIDFNSKNFTSVGTIGSGAITSTSTIQGTTITATTAISTDTISERTAAAGVTIDGLLIKDSVQVPTPNSTTYSFTNTTGTLQIKLVKTSANTVVMNIPGTLLTKTTSPGGISTSTSWPAGYSPSATQRFFPYVEVNGVRTPIAMTLSSAGVLLFTSSIAGANFAVSDTLSVGISTGEQNFHYYI